MNGLLHPSYEIDKTYIAQAQGVVKQGQLQKLAEGILLEDGMTAPAKVKLLKQAKDNSSCLVQLTIHEGRNRQVRRMLQAVGHKVLKLRRVGFAGLDLQGVALGSYRELKTEEVAALKNWQECRNNYGNVDKVIVVGAGPAGMMAAIKAAENGAEVVLLEK